MFNVDLSFHRRYLDFTLSCSQSKIYIPLLSREPVMIKQTRSGRVIITAALVLALSNHFDYKSARNLRGTLH